MKTMTITSILETSWDPICYSSLALQLAAIAGSLNVAAGSRDISTDEILLATLRSILWESVLHIKNGHEHKGVGRQVPQERPVHSLSWAPRYRLRTGYQFSTGLRKRYPTQENVKRTNNQNVVHQNACGKPWSHDAAQAKGKCSKDRTSKYEEHRRKLQKIPKGYHSIGIPDQLGCSHVEEFDHKGFDQIHLSPIVELESWSSQPTPGNRLSNENVEKGQFYSFYHDLKGCIQNTGTKQNKTNEIKQDKTQDGTGYTRSGHQDGPPRTATNRGHGERALRLVPRPGLHLLSQVHHAKVLVLANPMATETQKETERNEE